MARSTDAVAGDANPNRGDLDRADRGADSNGADPGMVIAVDHTTVDDYTHVMAVGWGAEVAPLRALHRHVLAEAKQRLFVAYCAGVPVGAASYVAFPRSAFLTGGVVLEAFRGRGLYRALVHTRLTHARASGIGLATTHARESTSAPILEMLGFATVCTIPMYFG